jgi:hypothetical protein
MRCLLLAAANVLESSVEDPRHRKNSGRSGIHFTGCKKNFIE